MNAEQIIDFLSYDVATARDYALFEIRKDNDAVIGMVGVEADVNVHPLFIKPEFRKKEFMSEVWKILTSKLKKNFIMSVYETNAPVISFYERNNGKLLGTQILNNQNILVYSFDQGSL